MPDLPPIIYTPPTTASVPATAGPIYEAAPIGRTALMVSGLISSQTNAVNNPNGVLVYAGIANGRPAWSTNGQLAISGINTIVDYSGTSWRITRAGGYAATRVSTLPTPDGLTGWVLTQGTGSPIIVPASGVLPPVITP